MCNTYVKVDYAYRVCVGAWRCATKRVTSSALVIQNGHDRFARAPIVTVHELQPFIWHCSVSEHLCLLAERN